MTTTDAPIVPRVQVFCDGSCLGNPGPGGWAALLRVTTTSGVQEKMLVGSEKHTTNNRMELQAPTEALKALTKPCVVEVTTDSQYVIKGITEWMAGWKKRGWRTSANKPVENQELWIALDDAKSRHTVTWKWVKGHAGHTENERVDAAARQAAQRA